MTSNCSEFTEAFKFHFPLPRKTVWLIGSTTGDLYWHWHNSKHTWSEQLWRLHVIWRNFPYWKRKTRVRVIINYISNCKVEKLQDERKWTNQSCKQRPANLLCITGQRNKLQRYRVYFPGYTIWTLQRCLMTWFYGLEFCFYLALYIAAVYRLYLALSLEWLETKHESHKQTVQITLGGSCEKVSISQVKMAIANVNNVGFNLEN